MYTITGFNNYIIEYILEVFAPPEGEGRELVKERSLGESSIPYFPQDVSSSLV